MFKCDENEKAVIVLSGGMDSGVSLACLRDASPTAEIHAITFDYGSNHAKKEIAKAKVLAKRYATKHVIIPLGFIKKYFASSLLAGKDAIPEGHYEAENMKSTVVPFRNGIMLAIAAGYAETIGAKRVYIGAHSGDHHIYPDCRPDFIASMSEACAQGTFNEVAILAPFRGVSKRDIAEAGKTVKFNFRDTYTCYKGGAKHCGKCGSCTERKEALAGFDPTSYEDVPSKDEVIQE